MGLRSRQRNSGEMQGRAPGGVEKGRGVPVSSNLCGLKANSFRGGQGGEAGCIKLVLGKKCVCVGGGGEVLT